MWQLFKWGWLGENPERPHQGGEDAGQKGCFLHEDSHGGVVHVPAVDGKPRCLNRLEVRVSHISHFGKQSLKKK